MQGVPFTTAALAPYLPSQHSLSHPGASLEVLPRTDPDCDLHIAWEAAEKLMPGSHQKGFADIGPTGPCREAGVLYCCPAHLDCLGVCKALLEVVRAGITGGHILPIYRSSERFSNLLNITQGSSKYSAVSSVKLKSPWPLEENFGQAKAGLTFAEP